MKMFYRIVLILTWLVITLPAFAFDVSQLSYSDLYGEKTDPPADIFSVCCPESAVAGTDRNAGLPSWTLPDTLCGLKLEQETLKNFTTMCGLRFIHAEYGGDMVVEVVRCPLREEKSFIGFADSFGEQKAWSTLNTYYANNSPDGMRMYLKKEIDQDVKDMMGVVWFTTKGRSDFMKLGLPGVRHGIWWRKENWVFGIDAGSEKDRERAVEELIIHLAGLR